MCAGDGKERRGEDPHGVLESQEGADSERGWTLNLRRKESPSTYQERRRRVQIQERDCDRQDEGAPI